MFLLKEALFVPVALLNSFFFFQRSIDHINWNFNDLTNTKLDQILISFKKALQVIFQYNQTNKRILFIGLPSKLELRINSMTQRVAISNSFNIQGLISEFVLATLNIICLISQTVLYLLGDK